MSLASNTAVNSSPDFRLKAGLFPFTVLEIARYQRESFEAALRAKVAEAPAFFSQTPVILGMENYTGDGAPLPLEELRDLCRQYNMVPVALRGADAALSEQAREIGMAVMSQGRDKAAARERVDDNGADPDIELVAEKAAPEAEGATADAPLATRASKLITTPVRSGQQVYAAGGDLIILAAVSPGAEVLADGNIHIYGALRGRALAGVRGDTQARIFCHSLEAELISIAGNFKLDEDLRDPHWQQSVQVSLDDQALHITPLAR